MKISELVNKLSDNTLEDVLEELKRYIEHRTNRDRLLGLDNVAIKLFENDLGKGYENLCEFHYLCNTEDYVGISAVQKGTFTDTNAKQYLLPGIDYALDIKYSNGFSGIRTIKKCEIMKANITSDETRTKFFNTYIEDLTAYSRGLSLQWGTDTEYANSIRIIKSEGTDIDLVVVKNTNFGTSYIDDGIIVAEYKTMYYSVPAYSWLETYLVNYINDDKIAEQIKNNIYDNGVQLKADILKDDIQLIIHDKPMGSLKKFMSMDTIYEVCTVISNN